MNVLNYMDETGTSSVDILVMFHFFGGYLKKFKIASYNEAKLEVIVVHTKNRNCIGWF